LSVEISSIGSLPISEIISSLPSSTKVSRNSDNSILYSLTNTGKRKYDRKFLLDEFGNEVVGITDKNTTIVKKQTLPLVLDRFNAPVKQPVKII
jgi:hypothetical protein